MSPLESKPKFSISISFHIPYSSLVKHAFQFSMLLLVLQFSLIMINRQRINMKDGSCVHPTWQTNKVMFVSGS